MQKYCYIYQYLFKELPNNLKKQSSDVVMNIEFMLINLPFNMRCALRRHARDYNIFSEDHIEEMVNMCNEYLNLGGHSATPCTAV